MIISSFLSYFNENNPYRIFEFDTVPVLPAVYGALMDNINYTENEVSILKDFFIFCDKYRFQKNFKTVDKKTIDKYYNKAEKLNSKNNIIKSSIVLSTYFHINYEGNEKNPLDFILDIYDPYFLYIEQFSKTSKYIAQHIDDASYSLEFHKETFKMLRLTRELEEKNAIIKKIELENRKLNMYLESYELHERGEDGEKLKKSFSDINFDLIKFVLVDSLNSKSRREIAIKLKDMGLSNASVGTLLYNSKEDGKQLNEIDKNMIHNLGSRLSQSKK